MTAVAIMYTLSLVALKIGRTWAPRVWSPCHPSAVRPHSNTHFLLFPAYHAVVTVYTFSKLKFLKSGTVLYSFLYWSQLWSIVGQWKFDLMEHIRYPFLFPILYICIIAILILCILTIFNGNHFRRIIPYQTIVTVLFSSRVMLLGMETWDTQSYLVLTTRGRFLPCESVTWRSFPGHFDSSGSLPAAQSRYPVL